MDLEGRLSQVQTFLELGLLEPNYERLLEQHYSAWLRPGDVVLDVGAHSGRHLRRFVELVGPEGRAIAFEPLPGEFKYLRDTFQEPSVELHQVALGLRNERTTFVYAAGAPEESGLRERLYNNAELVTPERIPVKVRTLDSFGGKLTRLDWLKIDVEGGEIDCLRGGTRSLERLRPIVSLEYGKGGYGAYGHQPMTLFDLSSHYDYVLVDLFLNPLDTRRKWLIACDSVYWDYLMVPRERLGPFLQRLKASRPRVDG